MKPKFIGKAKITKQGQVTVPSEARSAIGVDLNEDMYWYQVNGTLIATKDLVCEEDLVQLLHENDSNKKRKSRRK